MGDSLRNDEVHDKFRTLYKTYARSLIMYAAKFVDKTTAEDLVQDVFLKIWQKRSFLVWEDGLQAYLFTALQHACLDHLKRIDLKNTIEQNLLHKITMEELRYTDYSASFWNENQRLQSIYREIAKLPEKCREIFTMSYLEERKTADIASLLNISKRTVEAQLYKALKIIREALLNKDNNSS